MAKRWLTSKDLICRWQAEPFEILEAHKKGLPFHNELGEIIIYPLSEDHKLKNLNSDRRRKLEKHLKDHDEYLLNQVFINYEPISDPWEDAIDVEVVKFKLADIEKYEQQHGISPDAEAIKEDIQKLIDVPEGTSWRKFKLIDIEAYEEKPGISPVHVVTGEIKQKDIFPQDDLSFPDVTRWNDVIIKVVTGGNLYERGIEIKLPGKDWEGILYEELKLKPDSVLVEKLELLAKGESVNNKKSGYATDISRLRTLLSKIFPNIKGDPIPFKRKKDKYEAAFKIEETEAIVD